MRIQELVRESLVGKTVEFNAQELIVLSTFVETIKSLLNISKEAIPFTEQEHAIELFQKTVILLTPIISGVEGLEATAKELFTIPEQEVPKKSSRDQYL